MWASTCMGRRYKGRQQLSVKQGLYFCLQLLHPLSSHVLNKRVHLQAPVQKVNHMLAECPSLLWTSASIVELIQPSEAVADFVHGPSLTSLPATALRLSQAPDTESTTHPHAGQSHELQASKPSVTS